MSFTLPQHIMWAKRKTREKKNEMAVKSVVVTCDGSLKTALFKNC